MNRRLHIDRLELDLRGVDPAVAEAAVRLLGPALQAQLAHAQGPLASAARIDAGRVAASSEPQALANGLAQRIARSAGAAKQGS
jgi:hypothetical protein